MVPGLLADWQRCVFLQGQEEPGLRRISGHLPDRPADALADQSSLKGLGVGLSPVYTCPQGQTGCSLSEPPSLTRPLAAPFLLNPQLHPWGWGEQLQPPDRETEAQDPFCPGSEVSLEPGHGLRLWGQLGAPGWPGLGWRRALLLVSAACPLDLQLHWVWLECLGLWPARPALGVCAGPSRRDILCASGLEVPPVLSLGSGLWPVTMEKSEDGVSWVFPTSQCLSAGGGPGRDLCWLAFQGDSVHRPGPGRPVPSTFTCNLGRVHGHLLGAEWKGDWPIQTLTQCQRSQ